MYKIQYSHSPALTLPGPSFGSIPVLVNFEASALISFLRGSRPRFASASDRAISPSVVSTEELVEKLPHHVIRRKYRVAQSLAVRTRDLDTVQAVSTHVGDLIERGVDVSASAPAYISTELSKAKLDALDSATQDARRRAEILIHGLGGKLGRVRSSSLGVYQVTPRFSNDVTDYGVNDVTSRDKDVNAVVSVTFDVKD